VRVVPVIHLTNARILTQDPTHPAAREVTIAAGRIVAVDSLPPTGARRVDCRGGVLLPGFVDPHVHLLAAAAALRSIDCSPRAVCSIVEIQARLREAALDGDGWMRAVGYDESALAEQRHPTRWDLDAAVPHRPVRLLHRSGHAVVLNSLALGRAGITIASEEPPGGVIERRLTDGEPTGLLIDMDAVVERAVPPLPFAEIVLGLRALSESMLAQGITAVQDMTHRNDVDRLNLLDQACESAGFRPRRLPPATAPSTPGKGPVKVMLPEAAGIGPAERTALIETIRSAHRAGRQTAMHAITAEAVRAALDAIEQTLAETPRPDHRHRIEHAAVCPPDLAQRAAALGVVIVSNPGFLIESGARYRATVPATDLPWLYAAGSLHSAGVATAAASDAPVTSTAPLDAVRAAITRRDATGATLPGERATLADALVMITRAAAFAAFAEDRFGVIAPGKAADLVLLDSTPDTADAPRVWWTVIDGEAAYVAAPFE